MKKLILIMFLCSVASGTTYTSSQNGSWNDVATWGGSGYPIDGDKAVIADGTTVTVNVTSICGLNASTDTSLQVNGELVMNADLTVNGITKLRKCIFNQGAGTTLLIGGTYAVITDSGAVWNINGTSESRATVRTAVSQYWWIDDLSTSQAFYPNFNYADIKRMGNSSQRIYFNGGNVSWQLYFDHCLFDSCGGIYIGYDAVPANSTTISIKNCDWRNVQSQYILYLRTFPQDVQGKIQIRDNTFHSRVSGGSRIDFAYLLPTTDNYIDFRNNILHNVTLNLGRNTTVDSCWSWNPSVTYGTTVNFTNIDNFYTVKNSVLYALGTNAHLVDATNAITQARLYDLVSIDSGNTSNTTNHFLPTSFNGSWDIARCLVIGGNAVGTRNTTYTSGTINIDRLTHIGRSDYDALLLNESNEIGGSTVVNLRSCIEYSLGSNAKRLADKLDAGTTNDVFDYLDYNNIYNLTSSDRYDTAQIKMTGKVLGDEGFGGSDQSVDPQFNDTSVSLKKFDKTYGGDSTIQSLMSRLMQKNGYDTTGAVATFDTDFTVGNLLNYFRTAYTPQNQALNDAGYSGVDIGAVDITSSVPLEFSDKALFVDAMLSGLPLDTTITNYSWTTGIYGTRTYNPVTRSTLTGTHKACATLDEGLKWMGPGDTLYIRGGDHTDSVVFTDYDNYTSTSQGVITSYPNEWARLDGSIEYRAMGGARWLTFERFEIANGYLSIHRAKNCTVKYMYIHDGPVLPPGYEYTNAAVVFGNSDEAASNCTVTQCCIVNGYTAGVKMFGDYVANPAIIDTAIALKHNEISYNYISGSIHGIHYKSHQFLSRDNTGSDSVENKKLGDKIHHNIVENITGQMWFCQDFIQVYNNIFKNCSMSFGEPAGSKREPFFACFYNNTLINSGCLISHSNLPDYAGTYVVNFDDANSKLHSYYYNFNNIYMDTSSALVAPLQLYKNDNNNCDITNVDMTKVHLNRNLFVPQTVGYQSVIIGHKSSYYTIPQVNALNSAWRNWLSTDSSVYGYKVSDVIINGDTTTRNGGINTSHPYLSGVTIPNYVGANNDDSIWVDNVLNLTNLSTGYVEQKIPANVIEQPSSVSVYQGTSTSFSVVARGSGTLTYQWYDDNVAIDTATSATWEFTADTSQSGSNIYCVVSNDTIPPDTSNIVKLTVNSYTTPVLTVGIDTIVLKVNAVGATLYQWFKDGDIIPGATTSRLVIEADSALYSDKPVYKCRVSNPADSIYTNEWKLDDNLSSLPFGTSGVSSLLQRLIVYTLFAQIPDPLVIVEQPHNSTVNNGATVSFSVTATNATGYQWYGNGSLISGATSSTYSFTATYALNGSSIYCLVSNVEDTISTDTVTLTVISIPLPTIAQSTDTITLTCTATGYDSLRWFHNGVATDSTGLTYTILADSAWYASKQVCYCMAYNVGGSTKSGEWVFGLASTGSRWSAFKGAIKSAYERAFR